MLFSVNLRYKNENLNKIWKFKNPRWRPPVTSFIWVLLPWKPIIHHVISFNWKNKWSLLYVPNFKSIGWIVSKVEGGSDWPPPLKASCNYFFFEASKVKNCRDFTFKVYKKRGKTCSVFRYIKGLLQITQTDKASLIIYVVFKEGCANPN